MNTQKISAWWKNYTVVVSEISNPDIAWETIAKEVYQLTPEVPATETEAAVPATYRVTVYPINRNNPGADEPIVEVGFKFMDFIGQVYEVIAVNETFTQIDVSDVLLCGYCPASGRPALIYKTNTTPAGETHPPVTIDPESADLASIGEDQVLTINRQDAIPVAPEYGNLYNWYVTQEDIAPTGWHVPTKEEWETLLNEIDVYDSENNLWPLAGGKLKETGILHWNLPNTGATNEVSFNAIGSGWRSIEYGFNEIKAASVFITSTIDTSVITENTAFCFEMYNDFQEIYSGTGLRFKDAGSLRFIKNDSIDPGTVTDYDGNEYPTVKIGDQVWMAENFRGTHYNDGSPIDGPDFTDEEWAALTTPAYCIYKQTLDEKLADIDHNSTKNKDGGDEVNNYFGHVTQEQEAKISAIPAGGTTGQVLKKVSEDDYDTEWADEEGGGGGASVIQVTGLTLVAANWVADGSLFKYVLSNANITATSSVEVIPANASYDVLVAAEPMPETESAAGSVTMWVKNVPSADIPVTINITEVV